MSGEAAGLLKVVYSVDQYEWRLQAPNGRYFQGPFATEAQAQTRCNELNAGIYARMAKERAKRAGRRARP